ncbi:MAG: AbrB/MazE/SpoVT family DNA-binding domain-containing protein [Calditrichaceae bacterium]|nr:AbrB/MazE/SpoVT family DNA-binding domain-containing protein [Calditrichaceae bacterium]RQV96714.1 MAG: AbrB/MazE/SpoVT family DNA-binding domain-containing protein [Calditrichota bacterium]
MSTLTQKGQITIPKRVRKILNIEQGDEILFEISDKNVIIKKGERKANFNKYIGFLKNKDGHTSDEIVRQLREDL